MRSNWLMAPTQLELVKRLTNSRATWVVTGAAGFIGSNIVETLLSLGQRVVGLDNFSTGYWANLEEATSDAGGIESSDFRFYEGDIRDRPTCDKVVKGADYVLHQAALGSVPRSIADPLMSHDVNTTGFLNMLDACRRAGVRRFVYAASSSTYGDEPVLPKVEHRIGNPLSPYAVTKLVDELYAGVYARSYGYKSIGLRYFNVFGARQDPNGAYAAVIPRWISAMINDADVRINGDGQTSRDFCYVHNAVQANLRAALAPDAALNQVYNVAVGDRTTLNDLFDLIRDGLSKHQIHYASAKAYDDFRVGDVRHSQADISKAKELLSYAPTHRLAEGLNDALPWYIHRLRAASERS